MVHVSGCVGPLDPATSSAEEMDERFERVVVCVLTALAALIQSQPDAVNARLYTAPTLTEEVRGIIALAGRQAVTREVTSLAALLLVPRP